MHEAFNTVLPILTLLLGAGLANFIKFSELRKSLRLDAADQLAELSPLLWSRGERDGWQRLNVAVSRLSIRLNLAGVHPDLVERLRASAIDFWQSAYVIGQDDDGDVWTADENVHDTWTEMSAVVAELLGTNSRIKSWWLGRRASELLRTWDEKVAALDASIAE